VDPVLTSILLAACALLLAIAALVALRPGAGDAAAPGRTWLAAGCAFLAVAALLAAVAQSGGWASAALLAPVVAVPGAFLLLLGVLRVAAVRRQAPADSSGSLPAVAAAGEGERGSRSLIQRIPQAFAVQVGGVIVFANRAFGKIFGRSLDAVIGHPLTDFVRSEYREALVRPPAQTPHSPTWGTARNEVAIEHRDGAPRWVEVRRQVMEWEGTLGEVTFIDDITDRRRADEALRASEERYQLAMKASQEVMYDWDVAADAILWNQNTLPVLGYRPDEMAATLADWEELVETADRPGMRERLHGAMAGEAAFAGEYRLRRRDGTLAWVLDQGVVVRDCAGKAVRVVGAMTDLTERKRLEDQLRLTQKIEAVGNLGGGIAHDFNNLLTAILGSCEILQRRQGLDEPGREELGVIHRATVRAGELTRGLLALASRQVLEALDLDLNELIRSDLPIIRRLIPDNVTVEQVVEVDSATVHADPGQLQQVLINLCVNARDAMPAGGVITVKTERVEVGAEDVVGQPWVRPGPHVMMSVSDNGVGMAAETMSHIFEPFYTTKEPGRGTGLGLATLYGIVRQHGGMVQVESTPGMGTTFKVGLPIVERTAAEVREPVIMAPVGGDERILVVEDEDEVRRVLVEVLRGLGYRVVEARDGVEALERLESSTVDLIITDVVMPRMGGRELLQRVRQANETTLFLFSSGYSEGLAHDGTIEDDRVSFIGKPYGIDALARKVRDLLDRRVRSRA
jgi:two-component system cell cycle sensor histidine kinase/response regulator CckA